MRIHRNESCQDLQHTQVKWPPVLHHLALSRHIQFQLYSSIELTGLCQMIAAPIDAQFANHDVVVPEIIVVLKDNDIIIDSKIQGTPDLVIEILSLSTSSRDEGLKKQLHETHCVPKYRVIGPKKNEVRRFVLLKDSYADPECCAKSISFAGAPNAEGDLTQVW